MLSTEYSDNIARFKIVSDNSEPHILKSSIEIERQRCEIHNKFINLLRSNSENGDSKDKKGENTDIMVGKKLEECLNTETIERIQASFEKLLRISFLRGDSWKKIIPEKMYHLVHTDLTLLAKKNQLPKIL
ncbi:13413_t:CDS:1 [Ambispora leptoticha]|uniref:13413_t:CDS:1 n=1 Tax=Ambispora leptoticha TaxID=144679 RepID=A0A9N9DR50_9GLOM|nr:13413_t:CDS:1 [Ambispora leptoticha]